MKKYIIWCIIVALWVTLVSAKDVLVTARVWVINSKPVVLSVNPANNPKLLWVSTAQSYTLYFRDDEKNPVTYTITPDAGFTNISNGVVNTYDSQSGAYINFTYFAPSTPLPNERVIVTLNDNSSTGVTVKQLNLYIY